VHVLFKDTGRQTLRVALIYGDAVAAPSPRYFHRHPGLRCQLHHPVRRPGLRAEGATVSTAAALSAVRTIATGYSGTTVMDQSAYKQQRAKTVQQELTLVYALPALAILIALLGIGNTPALSIFERTRELGVLRAVGMTRRQLRATIRWESVIIALQGTVLGLLIGMFFGWALVLAMKDQGITEFSIPVVSLVAVVVLAALAGLLAAIPPSRRAAKLNILKAVVSE
jgi:putative ABC transport system permease protein